jgi:hypothetical protein
MVLLLGEAAEIRGLHANSVVRRRRRRPHLYRQLCGSLLLQTQRPILCESIRRVQRPIDFDRCKREMQSYRDEVESYLSCLKRESEQLRRDSDGAISDYNDAVASFNRRARG